jgi:phage-related protein (TIGR01555 family)
MLNGFGKQIKRKRRRKQKPRLVKIDPKQLASADAALPAVDFGPSNVVPIGGEKKAKRRVQWETVLARARHQATLRRLDGKIGAPQDVFKPYIPPPRVLPEGQTPLAMDSATTTAAAISWAQQTNIYWTEGLVFPGYAYLSELTLRPEYRVMSQVIATEMTRKWITFQSTADEEISEEQDAGPDDDNPSFGPGAEGEEEKSDLDPNAEPTDDPGDEVDDGGLNKLLAGDDAIMPVDPIAEATAPHHAELMKIKVAEAKQKFSGQQTSAEKDHRAAKLAGGMEDSKADRIKELEAEFDRLGVRDMFYKLAEYDGWFGRVHLFIDIDKNWGDNTPDEDGKDKPPFGQKDDEGGEDDEDKQESVAKDEVITREPPRRPSSKQVGPLALDDQAEMQMDIGDGQDDVSAAKVQKGWLKRLAVIEPLWTYPQNYESSDPLKAEWYNPSMWFVMGKRVHASRLLTFVGRPVPDILKPAYGFGGLSLNQIARPYVDNWLQTRQSVNDIIHAFSVMVLMTDMGSQLQASDQSMPGEGSDLFARLDMFNLLRDNRGVFAIDKEGEDFKNIAVPLSTLDQLQAQAQEHMASVSRIPLVKLLGISPHGLNASSEGELKAFYDTIAAFQEQFFRPNLTKVMHFAMLNLWGEVDDEITFKFEPLEELNAKEQAEMRKIEAETDDILVNGANALHPEEVRKRVASDPESPYADIDVADAPDAPDDDASPLNLHGTAPFGGKGGQGGPPTPPPGMPQPPGIAGPGGAQASPGEPGQSDKPPPGGKGASPFGDSAAIIGDSQGLLRSQKDSYAGLQEERNQSPISPGTGFDAEWKESDHPRVKGGPHAGEFGQGGGSSPGGAGPAPGAPGQVKPIGSGQYAGMYETKGASPKENHALTVSKVLAKPAQKGIHYRRLLAALIKEAPGFGGQSAIDPLKKRLGEALGMTHASLQAAGKFDEAKKVAAQAGKLGLGGSFLQASGEAKAKAPVTPQLPPPSAPAATPKAAAEPPAKTPFYKIEMQVAKLEAAGTLPKPTEGEIAAAKKTTPFYPVPADAEGKALVKPFNDKYEGKAITDPKDLAAKVAEYKALKIRVHEAETTASNVAAQKEAEKYATPEMKEHYHVLAGIMGGGKEAANYISHAENKLKSAGWSGKMNGAEAAHIIAYSSSHYGPVNSELRKGSLTEKQYLYAKALDSALQKLPAYKGVTYRKTDINNPADVDKYQVGKIVAERAFTSTSKNQGTWSGQYRYVITGKSGRDIQPISSHASESEVLFPMNTHFKVTKRQGNEIHMEEV